MVLEVQQQLGGGIVRTIAMGSSDGLRRGLDVKDLEHPIEVPVPTGAPYFPAHVRQTAFYHALSLRLLSAIVEYHHKPALRGNDV
ncbi:hypothetical protein MJM99_34430, partial [Salmonella enterica subsp. enterica serovar Kentucky]|nr:hypothetical protein [Salmonella enterica subsp. enterica serovar Kentucky]